MKLAVQADFFIKRYGLEEGAKHIRSVGYDCVYYTIDERYDAPFTSEWTEEQIAEKYAPVGKAFADNGLAIRCVIAGGELFNDHKPETFDARIHLVEQYVIACRYLGCDTLAVKPPAFYKPRLTFKEDSRSNTYTAFDRIKAACDARGVRFVIINNGPNYLPQKPYGCSLEHLIELGEHYGAKILFNPLNANKAGKEADALVSGLGDSLDGFLVEDMEAALGSSIMPMMGTVDYLSIIEALKTANRDACVVMSMGDFIRRFARFEDCQNVYDAIDGFLFQMGSLFAGKL